MVLQSNFSKFLVMLFGFLLIMVASPGIGQENTNQSSGSAFSQKLQAVDTLLKIRVLMLDSRTQLRTTLSEVNVVPGASKKNPALALGRAESGKAVNGIEKNIDAILEFWKSYTAGNPTGETKVLAGKFASANAKFISSGLKPAINALRNDNYIDAKKYALVSTEIYALAANDLDELISAQLDAVQVQYQNDLGEAALAGGKAHGIDTPIAEAPASNNAVVYSVFVLFGFVVAGLALLTIRSKLASLPRSIELAQQIANGKYDNAVDVQRQDNFSPLLLAFKLLQTRLSAEQSAAAALAKEHKLYKQALNVMTQGVMLADTERNIILANQNATDTLHKMEDSLRQRMPQFDANNIVGQCIDRFHDRPQHQAALLAGLTSTVTSEFDLGGRANKVIATPVFDEHGVRIGTVAEWHDRTDERAAEREVVDMIRAIMEGDFKSRIRTVDKSGFLKEAGKGINSIIEIFDAWLKEIIAVFSGIETGDLTRKIADDGDDAGVFSELAQHTNAAVDNLHALVEQIHVAAEAINTASREMAEGNTDLSQRTEEQASSLEETASSMEELASTVKTNAENAKQANQMAAAASSVAAKGGAVVRDVVQTMESINASSSKIVDIISVIDGIAFQTNILALNAAVEAARAGEQGRGFAVVAGEVRTLAQKSASAAKEIKLLISDSVNKVDMGFKQVKEAGDTMGEIVTSVKRVTDIMDEISAASVEQSAGIDQVNQAITQMDEVTQQNASLVEESAAASTSLEEQAQSLMQAVGVFKLSEASAQQRISGSIATKLDKRQGHGKFSNNKKTKTAAIKSEDDWQEF
jgi:methyl-accepting chemotaxis protein